MEKAQPPEKAKILTVAILISLGFFTVAVAGERSDGRGSRIEIKTRTTGLGHYRHHGADPIYGGDDFPSFIPGRGTYSGSLSALRQRGNGTYYRVERRNSDFAGDVGYELNPLPKIINVTPGNAGQACAWEPGVCVIR